jgi:hypothetical protein
MSPVHGPSPSEAVTAIPDNRPVRYPATPGQEAMWLLWRLHPDLPLNHMLHEFRLDGPLDVIGLRS